MDVDYSGRTNPPMADRNDWMRNLERLDIPVTRRAIAMYLAWKGNDDGSRILVGEKRIARITGLDVTTVRGHMKKLRKMGLIHRKSRGSGRGRAETGGPWASVHYLSYPDDMSTLPWRLDPDGEESDQPLTQLPEEQPAAENTGDWRAVIGLVHRAQALGDSTPAPVDNPYHRVPAPAVPSRTVGAPPVDNLDHRVPLHGDSSQSPGTGAAITENWSGYHRELDPLSPSAGARQPNYYQPTTNPPTPCGHLSRVPHVAREADDEAPPIQPVPPPRRPDFREPDFREDPPGPDGPASPHIPEALRVTDDAYSAAYEKLSVLPDGGAFLLARAVAELAGEGYPDAPARTLAVRAAAIKARLEPRSA